MSGEQQQFFLKVSRWTDIVLWFFAVPLIPMIVAEFFTELSPEMEVYFTAYYFVLWMVFTADFFLRLIVVEDRMEYLRANWLDVLVVLSPAFKTFKIFSFMRFPVLFLSDRALHAVGSLGFYFFYYIIFVAVVVLVVSFNACE